MSYSAVTRFAAGGSNSRLQFLFPIEGKFVKGNSGPRGQCKPTTFHPMHLPRSSLSNCYPDAKRKDCHRKCLGIAWWIISQQYVRRRHPGQGEYKTHLHLSQFSDRKKVALWPLIGLPVENIENDNYSYVLLFLLSVCPFCAVQQVLIVRIMYHLSIVCQTLMAAGRTTDHYSPVDSCKKDCTIRCQFMMLRNKIAHGRWPSLKYERRKDI
jgi:hypothetical protein